LDLQNLYPDRVPGTQAEVGDAESNGAASEDPTPEIRSEIPANESPAIAAVEDDNTDSLIESDANSANAPSDVPGAGSAIPQTGNLAVADPVPSDVGDEEEGLDDLIQAIQNRTASGSAFSAQAVTTLSYALGSPEIGGSLDFTT
jgi:hypothetical protein